MCIGSKLCPVECCTVLLAIVAGELLQCEIRRLVKEFYDISAMTLLHTIGNGPSTVSPSFERVSKQLFVPHLPFDFICRMN
jgi:hypothetical protein